MADMTPLTDILNGDPADATDVQTNFQIIEAYINGVDLIRADGTEVMAASLDMDTNKIVNLTSGTASTDAANWGQVPRGVMGYAESTSNQIGVTSVTDLTSLTTTFTGVAGRLYKATMFLPRCYTSTAGTELTASITDGSNSVYNYCEATVFIANGFISVTVVALFTLTGSGTVKGRLTGTGGNVSTTGSATARKVLVVEDIGLA